MRHGSWNPFLRFPRASLALVGVLCLPLLALLAQFKVSSETRVLLEGDQRNLASYEKVRQILAEQEILVVSLEVPEVFAPAGLEAVRRVSEAFEAQPGVMDVKSLTHSSKPVRRGLSFEMEPLVPRREWSEAELQELKRFALTHPLVKNLMVAPDSRHTVITVTYERELRRPGEQRAFGEEVERVLAPFRAEGLRFQVVALPLIEEEVRSTLWRDVRWMVPAALVLLVVILLATFRSWKTVLLVLANQVAVILIVPGLIELAGFDLTVFSVMLLPLLTGVHLTLLAHVYASWQRALNAGQKGEEAIESMLAEVFKSCCFAALTTAVGLASLALTQVRQIREFGLLGTAGVGLIFFMTFGPGLAALSLVSGDDKNMAGWLGWRWRGRAGLGERSGRCATWVAEMVEHRRGVISMVALLALAAAIWGMRLVRTDVRAVEFLGRSSPTRQAVESFDRLYGGINVVQIEVDSAREGGVNELEFLKYMEGVQRFAESQAAVSGVYSYAQLMAMVNQIWEGGRPESLRLPDNPLVINLFMLALKAQNYPFLAALADGAYRTAYVVVRTRDMPAEQYLALVNNIVEYARAHKPERVQVSATRGIHLILEADRRIVRSQVGSVGFTALIIGLVLFGLWRSPVLALLALAINALAVVLVIGLAGYAGIPLNSITVMVGAIALGMAVDDAVHFITHWRELRARGLNNVEAVCQTFQARGRPIVATSVALVAIFGVFALSSFPPVVDFGLLSVLAFAAALLASVFFLPACLHFLPGGRPAQSNAKGSCRSSGHS